MSALAFSRLDERDHEAAAFDILTSGGDQRIVLDGEGRNRYNLPLRPVASPYSFSSTTASPLSARGYREVLSVYQSIYGELAAGKRAVDIYRSHVLQIKSGILTLLGYAARDDAAPRCILSPSGTDSHRHAAILLNRMVGLPLTFLTIEDAETGSGVPHALQKTSDGRAHAVVGISAREEDGSPLNSASIESEINRQVQASKDAGSRAVLVVTDVSKTGVLWPSLRSVLNMKERWGSDLEVVVDACQMRVSPSVVREYLAHGFMVIITGSKFLGGPTFSGALLIPSDRKNVSSSDTTFRNKVVRPECDVLRSQEANFGLVLRWRAALAEWTAFCALNESLVISAIDRFSKSVRTFIDKAPQLELLSTPLLGREEFEGAHSWSARQSIFTFLIKGRDGSWMGRQDLAQLHAKLAHLKTPILLGQPVSCGVRGGAPVAALRLSLSAPMLTDIASDDHLESVIQNAVIALITVLDLRP